MKFIDLGPVKSNRGAGGRTAINLDQVTLVKFRDGEQSAAIYFTDGVRSLDIYDEQIDVLKAAIADALTQTAIDKVALTENAKTVFATAIDPIEAAIDTVMPVVEEK